MQVVLEELLLWVQFFAVSNWVIASFCEVGISGDVVVNYAAHDSILSLIEARVGIL